MLDLEMRMVERSDIIAAEERIRDLVERTALIETRIHGVRVWLKCECLQTGGAFKLGGATTGCYCSAREERSRESLPFPPVTVRGGRDRTRRLEIRRHHRHAVGCAGVKVEGTKRRRRAKSFSTTGSEGKPRGHSGGVGGGARKRGRSSFDDAHIVAGQGTAVLELLDQLANSRCAATQADRHPHRRRRPRLGNCARLPRTPRSSASSRRVWTTCADRWRWARSSRSEPDAPPTLCDALQTPCVSPITLGILRARRGGGRGSQRRRGRGRGPLRLE